jgi:hypothetical protein
MAASGQGERKRPCLLVRSRLLEFPSSPSCGVRGRTLGPGPEIRGDGQAAAQRQGRRGRRAKPARTAGIEDEFQD